jgi:hypothetical protein
MTRADRDKIHAMAVFLIGHHAQLEYPRDDVRGAADAATWKLDTWGKAELALKRGKHLCFDCSQSTTQIMRWAGVRDPNGLAYRHAGYTGTMLNHLPHYSDARRADVGALVVFGPGTGDHVAMVIEPDHEHGDPLLFSHGAAHLAGPIRLSVERQYHRPPVTFLSVAGL